MKRTIRKGLAYTVLCDVLMQLVVGLVVAVDDEQQSHERTKAIASEVPGLHEENRGLRGMLKQADDDRQFLADQGRRYRGKIQTLTDALGEQGDKVGQLTEELDRLRPGPPIDLVIVLDSTASMAPHHANTRGAMASLFKFTWRLSSEVRIGVVSVRQNVVDVFPLTVIRPADQDQSQASLLKFLDGLTTKNSILDPRPGFARAVKMLPHPGREGRRQVLIYCGDRGLSEISGDERWSAEEKRLGQQVVAGAGRWVNAAPRRVFGTVYVGAEQGGGPDHDFFRDLAHPVGAGHFATNSVAMFQLILDAMED